MYILVFLKFIYSEKAKKFCGLIRIYELSYSIAEHLSKLTWDFVRCAHSCGVMPTTGRFNQEPHYFKKFEFPTKKRYAFFAIWTNNALRKDSQFESFLPNCLFKQYQRKSHPEKNWREFWIDWNIGTVTYQKYWFL